MNKGVSWSLFSLAGVLALAPAALAQPPWNALRPLTELAARYDPWVKAAVFAASLALFAIAALAYYRKKSRRTLFVAAAFFFFAVKWAIKVADLFLSPGTFFADASENVAELVIFAFLFLALFKR